MCGIVGYIGNKKASTILIDGLSKLEYRGYDSAGISTLEDSIISVLKDKGRVKNLSDNSMISYLNGTVGIAHTRWATHGKPSKENAHPHLDNSKSFSVVHNGIIENYNELKDYLIEKGYDFYSQTDTEVIPNLIHFFYNTTSNKNLLNAVKSACDDLKGSYAIEVICKDFPDEIVVAKKDSPMVIGMGKDENFVASDIPAILSYTNEFYFMEDNEFAVIKKDSVRFYDKELSEISKELKTIDWDANSADKNGFEDYMLKEIYEQPDSIRKTIVNYIDESGNYSFKDIQLPSDYIKSLSKIYIVACGTAMHAGLATKNTIEQLCGISTEVDIASEFRYRNPLINDKTLCIFISQSGETADTIAALKLSKSCGAKTIAVTNVIGSSITREADYSIYTYAGPEIAVASTKAYTAQVTLLAMLTIYFAQLIGKCDINEINSLKQSIASLPQKIEEVLNCNDKIKEFAKKVYQEKDIFFLGRGIDYPIALEGSLKLKEISYIHSEAYPAGELKHGPIALIENGSTVVSIFTNENLVTKTVSNVQEVITRGAKILAITNQSLQDENYNATIRIPVINKFISPVIAIIPLQLLSYYISKEKGLDVDKPRNLAKSVTVE